MATELKATSLTRKQELVKRGFDLLVALLLLLLLGWLILAAALVARFDTGLNGFFLQERVGRFGRLFTVIKIRTMKPVAGIDTSVTTASDERVTSVGRILRKTKLDELPQIVNILLGDMSFVGPRPDVPGFADKLNADERVVLSVRPGITGPATLKYRDEESILEKVEDPERYNREVIYPDKVRINMGYVENYSFFSDIKYIFMTLI